MASKPENKLWTEIRPHIKRLGHYSRIESHSTALGVPDLHLFMEGKDYWIELKVAESNGQIKIKPTQKMWHKQRRRHGGGAFVLIKATGLDRNKYYILSPDINLGDHVCDHSDRSVIWENKIDWTQFKGALKNA